MQNIKGNGGKTRTEKFAITTERQWQLELPSFLDDEKVSSMGRLDHDNWTSNWRHRLRNRYTVCGTVSENEDEAITGQIATAFTSA